MLKSLSRGVSKFFTTERIIILVVFLILAWGLWTYSDSKLLKKDNMETGSKVAEKADAAAAPPSIPLAPAVAPLAPTAAGTSATAPGYSAQSVATPQDLLPKDQNSQWAALNPVSQGNIAAPDLLQAGYHIGLDTIGQTLRNANLQERSDPIIPKSAVGPWNQSTIEPDLGRVPLELGSGAR
jgi:hypothetical protein